MRTIDLNAQQLDLFLDSYEVSLANEVVAALCAHDSERTAQSIARLRSEAPERPDLPAFESLEAFLALFRQLAAEVDSSALTPEAIEVVLEILDSRIIPCASVLGSAARDFLKFFWRQLARVATQPFDPGRPHLHAADLFLHAEAYEAVEEAAKGIVGHSTDRAVLRWRAIARYRLASLKGARLQIFALAWYAAAAFPELLAELGDARLDKDWQAFQADADELDASWFPAWYLLRHPEAGSEITDWIAHRIQEGGDRIPSVQACLLLARILDLEKNGHSRALVEQRARLRAIDAGFFAIYMRSRDVRHR